MGRFELREESMIGFLIHLVHLTSILSCFGGSMEQVTVALSDYGGGGFITVRSRTAH